MTAAYRVHQAWRGQQCTNIFAGCQFDQREQMFVVRMHTAIAQQPDEMQDCVPVARRMTRRNESRIGEKRPVFDRRRNPDQILHDNASGPEIEVTYLAVSHLPDRQADRAS